MLGVVPNSPLVPPTVRVLKGEAVLIPTLPLEFILIASAPPSANPIVSAAGANTPVFVSPLKVIEGRDAVPALKVVGEVKFTPRLFIFVIGIFLSLTH
jgi:hypothetical protein